jgi:hypothetical protein
MTISLTGCTMFRLFARVFNKSFDSKDDRHLAIIERVYSRDSIDSYELVKRVFCCKNFVRFKIFGNVDQSELAEANLWSDLDFYACIEDVSYSEILTRIVKSDVKLQYVYDDFATALSDQMLKLSKFINWRPFAASSICI